VIDVVDEVLVAGEVYVFETDELKAGGSFETVILPAPRRRSVSQIHLFIKDAEGRQFFSVTDRQA
jgi:hypothetical protein